MILLILFIVAMFLWLLASLPGTGSRFGSYSGLLPWVSVLLLYLLVHGVRV